MEGASQKDASGIYYVQDLYDKVSALDEFSRCMDPRFQNIKNWEFFAFALGVPADVIRTCKLYSEYSPTIRLFKYLEITRPDMTVGDLRAALTRNPQRTRYDLDRMLQDAKLENECKVSEDITNSTSEIVDQIALKLDSATPATCNWKSLGLELGLAQVKLRQFEMYTNYNPTETLFKCLYTTSPNTVKASVIVGYLEQMKRREILEEIRHNVTDLASKDAQDIFKLGSELLHRLSSKLNEDCQGLEGWRGLANHLIADNYLDDPDIISKLEPPRHHEIHSPTKKIIEWLTVNKQDITIDVLIARCEAIGRIDAVKILVGHFSRACDTFDDVPTTPTSVQEESTKARKEHILKDNLRSFGLPKPTTKMIGREKEKKNLIADILSGKNRLFVLHAATGFGKERLAVATAHELIEKHNYTCIYVDSDGILTVEDLAMKILTTCGIPAASFGEKDKVIELFKTVTRKCLLILDNFDHAFHADDKRKDSMVNRKITTYKSSLSGNRNTLSVPGTSSNIPRSSATVISNFPGTSTSSSCAPYERGIVHSVTCESSSSSYASTTQYDEHVTRKKKYQKFIEDLLKNSSNWTILATSWESFSAAVETKEVELPPLMQPNSEDLLLNRLELAHGIDRSSIPLDLLSDVLECCSGIPQLLCNAGALFVKTGFEDGARNFSSSSPERQLELLNTKKMSQKEHFHHCLGICFDRLFKTSQNALMMISVFPSFFSLKEAATVFKAMISSQTGLENALTELMDFSFLSYDQDHSAYYLSPAMRSFAIHKATTNSYQGTPTSAESDSLETELCRTYKSAISRYVYYTFDIISKIENDFFSTRSANAIQRYREQKVNIKEITNWFISDRLSKDPDMKRLRLYIIESFIECYLINLKLMEGNLLKTILRRFLMFCRWEEGMESTNDSRTKGTRKQYVECLTYGGLTCILGCLCVPQLCPVALEQAMWCFDEVLKALCTSHTPTTSSLNQQLKNVSTCEVMSKGAQTQFLLKYGKCLVRYGRKDEGLKFIRKGIEIRKKVFKKSKSTKDRVMLAVGYNDLASAYSYNNDSNGTAIQIRESKVLPVYREYLGRHPFTATALSHLAHDYLALGLYKAALKACEKSLSYRKRLLGEHSETARSFFDTGYILRNQAEQCQDSDKDKRIKLERALYYLEEALKMRQHLAFTPKERAENHIEIVRVLKLLKREREAKEHEEKAGTCIMQVDHSHMGEAMDTSTI